MRALIGFLAIWTATSGAALAQGQPADLGSRIPVMLWFIGAGILGLVIAYGIFRNRSRTRAEKRLTEKATEELYRNEQRKH